MVNSNAVTNLAVTVTNAAVSALGETLAMA